MPTITGTKTKNQPANNTAKKQKVKKVVEQERAVIYPDVDVIKLIGNDALTPDIAKDYLGWQTEEDFKNEVLANNPKAKEKDTTFGDNYLLKDWNGVKVRCTNNDHNRPFDEGWAKTLSQDMLTKNWRLNGETIIVGKTGRILSGQHRLVGLVLAELLRNKADQAEHWQKFWDGPVTMDALLARGIEEGSEFTRTLDNTKPRTLSDVIFSDAEAFGDVSPGDRKTMCRMLDYAVRMLWHRTGCKADAFTPRQTHSESLDFVARHQKIKKAVKAVWESYQTDGQTSWKVCSALISPGYAAALMYLMGSAGTDGQTYWATDPSARTEKQMDWSLWDLAKSFWDALANKDAKLMALREVLAKLTDMGGGSRVEKTALIAKAWQVFATGKIPKEDDLELEYALQGDIRYLDETPAVGGIDMGDPKNPSPWDLPEGITQLSEKARKVQQERIAAKREALLQNRKEKKEKEKKGEDNHKDDTSTKKDKKTIARDNKLIDIRGEHPGKILIFKVSDGSYKAWGSDAQAVSDVTGVDPWVPAGDHLECLEWPAAEWGHTLAKLLEANQAVVLCEMRGKEWVQKVLSNSANEDEETTEETAEE